jgi:hypothetical protein
MFDDLRLKRVYLHTLEWNHRAQKCFERSGFDPVRNVRRMSRDFILMEVFRDDWDETSADRLALRQQYLDQRGGAAVGDDDAVAAAVV